MATTRIADLPSALTINENAYLAIDSYTEENTQKVTPVQICSVLITSDELTELENMLNGASANTRSIQSDSNEDSNEGSDER